MPLISVVIPAYNAEKTIRSTIQSVLNQTFSDFELIVINDGSLDSTLEIVSSIPDPRIKVLSQPNCGPQKSRNRGVAEAVGEFISFLDADDLWTPDKLESQLKALQANPQAALAYSWTDWVDMSDNFLRRGTHFTANGDVYTQLLLLDFIESGSNPLIRKQALVEAGGFDESLVGGQDWDMWLRVAALYHVVAIPSPQILHRQFPNSWSTNVERQAIGLRKVIEKAFASYPERVNHFKKDIISNRYKCLTVDALQGYQGKKRCLAAIRFLSISIVNDPSIFRARVLIKIIFKILTIMILPPNLAQLLINKLVNLYDVRALYGYLKLNQSSNKEASVI